MIAKDIRELKFLELSLQDRLRVFRTRKKYLVLMEDKVHLVNDLDRLSMRIDRYDSKIAEVYKIR